MSPFSLRKLGVGILDEGLNLFYRVKEPLLVAAGAVVARELEHEHRVSARGFCWMTLSGSLCTWRAHRMFFYMATLGVGGVALND